MPQKRYKPEEIINKLRVAEVNYPNGILLAKFVESWKLQNRPIIDGVNNTEE